MSTPSAPPCQKPDLLLHVCCGPCATQVIEVLREDYRPVCFFYNPNIHPEEEFNARLEAVVKVARTSQVHLWVPPYRPEEWFQAIRGFEQEPEGGARCDLCYRLRLEETAKAAKATSTPQFTTTLTISPTKNSGRINRIGEEVSRRIGPAYQPHDFKKKNGFQQSVAKSRELGLYRQKTCGCRFSR